MINYIVTNVDSQFRVYSDLEGHTAAGGGSIPPELCVTTLKPDIVILDDKAKTIHLFELTCPSEHNIEQRHTEKSNKYAHFTTQLTSVNTSARWMLSKCHPKAFSLRETTPHWQHFTNSSTLPSSSHFSRRTSLHSH